MQSEMQKKNGVNLALYTERSLLHFSSRESALFKIQ